MGRFRLGRPASVNTGVRLLSRLPWSDRERPAGPQCRGLAQLDKCLLVLPISSGAVVMVAPSWRQRCHSLSCGVRSRWRRRLRRSTLCLKVDSSSPWAPVLQARLPGRRHCLRGALEAFRRSARRVARTAEARAARRACDLLHGARRCRARAGSVPRGRGPRVGWAAGVAGGPGSGGEVERRLDCLCLPHDARAILCRNASSWRSRSSCSRARWRRCRRTLRRRTPCQRASCRWAAMASVSAAARRLPSMELTAGP
jgi:hypothetical protein